VVVGIPLMLLAFALNRTGFFRRKTVAYGTEAAVAETSQTTLGA
jgi:hypothetical protein